MFDARDDYEEIEFDRRRPNRRDTTSRSTTSANRGRARNSTRSSRRKKSGGAIGGIHNRKNKHWNW